MRWVLASLIAAVGMTGCKGCQKQNAVPPAPPMPVVTGTATSLETATPAKPLRPQAPPDTARNPAGPPAKLDLAKLKLPPGFSIELYARVQWPRSLAVGDDDVVFVGTRRGTTVYAIAEGRPLPVAANLSQPNGVAYHDGALYVAEIGRILRYDDIVDNLERPPSPVIVTEALPKHRHHGQRYIAFGPDDWMYIGIGAPCNVCLEMAPLATISRMKPDGSGLETYALGVRNAMGFDWHPDTEQLWFTDNGRDALGDDLPPDELNRAVDQGKHFGFPHCHAGVIVDPEYGSECVEFTPPAQNLAAHVAPLGMRFYDGDMFPKEYKNSIFVAEHGSWNRKDRNGYRVMRAKLEGDRVVIYEPFLDGFHIEEGDEVMGRPVDVEVLEDGSLLVSDDHQSAIYRITYGAR